MIADADDAHTPASTPVSELQIPKKNANDAGQSEGSTNAFPRPDLQMQMMQEETMSAPSGATADAAAAHGNVGAPNGIPSFLWTRSSELLRQLL